MGFYFNARAMVDWYDLSRQMIFESISDFTGSGEVWLYALGVSEDALNEINKFEHARI